MRVALITLLTLGAGTPSDTAARWILVYAGTTGRGLARYTTEEFTRLVAHVDSAGRPVQWLCDGAIVLTLYAPSGHAFATWFGGTPADGNDWTEYLDSLFVPGGILARADSGVAAARTALGAAPGQLRISLMIPYPDAAAGSLTYAGRRFELRRAADRFAAAAAYVDVATNRFTQARFSHLALDGFYWLQETAPPADTSLLTQVARAVHARGLRLLWIPYYESDGWSRWRAFGFDEAWLQPNYFFDRNIPATRLDSAVARAERYGMGLEVEFDSRLYTDPRFADRLQPYLAALALHPELRARSIAIYDGGGGLAALSARQRPYDRIRYDRLAATLR